MSEFCEQNNHDDYLKLVEHYRKPQKLTVEELRSYKGCENINDASAEEIIDGLLKLSIIACKNFKHYESTTIK